MAATETPELLARDPLLASLYAYWNGRRGERRMPDRRDIDPIGLGVALLPHIGLMDIVDGGARVRYRLLGNAIIERWGSNPTGRFMDEVMTGTYKDYIHGLYRDVYRFRAPVFSDSTFRWDAGGVLHTRRLYLPLTHGGGDVAMALIGQVFLGPTLHPRRPYSGIVKDARMEQHSEVLEPQGPARG